MFGKGKEKKEQRGFLVPDLYALANQARLLLSLARLGIEIC